MDHKRLPRLTEKLLTPTVLLLAMLLATNGSQAAPKNSSISDADKQLVGGQDGKVFTAEAAERRAGHHSHSSSTCSGVDLIVKKVKMERQQARSVAVSATLANRCTGETTAETHWSVVTNADEEGGVQQVCSGPGLGLSTWETGALVVPANPRDQSTVVTVKIDPRNTVRGERSETNNACLANLPANTDSREWVCPR
jgi:hypothetical protein